MLNSSQLGRTDLNLLVVFEVVLEERHVGRAARRLNLTPSAVSHGLGRLRQLMHDPLFQRTPRGVVPTARAAELAQPIAEILARVRSVLATARPFDPATSKRRFTIGAPDGASAVFLPPLLAALQRTARGIDIGVRQLLPVDGPSSPERAWSSAFAELEARALDLAVVPTGRVPARFFEKPLYDEDFVVVMRAGHPFANTPTLARFCEAQHLVVSLGVDAHGFVDRALEKLGRSRRVALTVPNFLLALAFLVDSDLVAALPRRFVATHAERFGLVAREAPLRLPRFRLHAVASQSAMLDAGVAWLVELLRRSVLGSDSEPQRQHTQRAPRRKRRP